MKDPREKVANDAFYQIYQYIRKCTLEQIELFLLFTGKVVLCFWMCVCECICFKTLTSINIGLAESLFQFFCKVVWKNRNKLFDHFFHLIN